MVATLEAGLAWMDMATVDGGISAEAAREPSSSGRRGCGRHRPFGLASLPRSHLVSERLKWALARFVSELRQKWAHLQPQE